jgi:hypothetical protein
MPRIHRPAGAPTLGCRSIPQMFSPTPCVRRGLFGGWCLRHQLGALGEGGRDFTIGPSSIDPPSQGRQECPPYLLSANLMRIGVGAANGPRGRGPMFPAPGRRPGERIPPLILDPEQGSHRPRACAMIRAQGEDSADISVGASCKAPPSQGRQECLPYLLRPQGRQECPPYLVPVHPSINPTVPPAIPVAPQSRLRFPPDPR